MGIKVKEETYTGIADLRLKMKAGRQHLGRRGQRLGQRRARGRRRPPREARLQGDRRVVVLARDGRRVLRRRRRVLHRARVEHQDLRQQGPAELGRFLGREEIPRQARVSQGCRRRARARADGRRRAAEQGLRGAVGAGRHRARDQEDQGAEAARRRVVGVGRAARAADEGRRGRHDHRLERPLRRRGQGRRRGRRTRSTRACSTTTATPSRRARRTRIAR